MVCTKKIILKMEFKTLEQLLKNGATLLDVIGEAEIYEIGNDKYISMNNEIHHYFLNDSELRKYEK